MTTTTLQQVFGANASQDANYVYISKADLYLLATSPDNDASQLLAAIVGQAQKTYEGLLCDSSGNVLCDNDGFALGYDLSDSFSDLSVNFFSFYLPSGSKLTFCFLANFKKHYVTSVP